MRYLVESPHTREECLKELDELAGKGEKELQRFGFACTSGEHTGYAVVDAPDEKAARELVPAIVRGKAKIHPLQTFTAEQVRSFHSQ